MLMATHLERIPMRSLWLLCCVAVSGWCLGGGDAAKPAGTPLVLGLGPGLVAVIVLGFVCVLICAVGYSAENKSRFLIPVIVIVGGTALFFASVRVDTHTELATQTPTKYNRVAITRSAIAALMIAFTVVSGLSMLATHVLTHRQGRLIGDVMGRRSGGARVF